jgi:hypothetical protein
MYIETWGYKNLAMGLARWTMTSMSSDSRETIYGDSNAQFRWRPDGIKSDYAVSQIAGPL